MKWLVLCAAGALAASSAWSAALSERPGDPLPALSGGPSLPDLLPKALQGSPSSGLAGTDWRAFLRDHGSDPDVAAILKDHADDPKLPELLEALPRLGWWIRSVYQAPKVIMSPQPPGVIQLLPTPPHPPTASVKSSLLVYTPEDRKLFHTMHPLLTPDIPTTIYPAEQRRPEEASAAVTPGGPEARAVGGASGSPLPRQ